MSLQYFKLGILLPCILVWQTSSAKELQIRTQNDTVATSQDIASVFYDVLLGEIVTQNGAPSAGYALLLNGARASGDERLYQRATDIALRSRVGAYALEAAQAWALARPESFEANRYLWQILVLLNRPLDSVKALEQTLRHADNNQKKSIISSIPRIYKNFTKDTIVVDSLQKSLQVDLKDNKFSAIAWTSIGEIYLSNGRIPEAVQALIQAIEINNNYIESYYLAANLMLNKSTEAEKEIIKKINKNPTPEIRSLYTKALIEQKRFDDALVEASNLVDIHPEIYEAWILLAQIQIQLKKLNQASATLSRYIEIHPKDSTEKNVDLYQAYILQSEIARKSGNYIDAQNWINKIPENHQYLQVVNQQAYIFASQGKIELARGLLRTFRPTQENSTASILSAEINLLKYFKFFKEALETQELLVKLTPDDNEAIYSLAILAEKAGDILKMENTLKSLIKKSPDFYHAYNALGYSLADRGLRLQEAKTLIQKALELAPNDPFIIDSLGWVEFRLGNKKGALDLLEKAYKLQADAEIAAHLIEIYRSIGEPTKADNLLKKALDQFPSHYLLIKLQKISER